MSAFAFRVDADINAARAKLNRLKEATQNRVIVQAVNRTATTVRGRVIKKLSEETGTQQKIIRDKVTLQKAFIGKKGARNRYYATVTASRHTTNLIEYVKPSQRKPNYFNARLGKGKNRRYRAPGVKAKVWGKEQTYKGTFIGTSGSGALKVYARTGSERGKLKLISGPSLRNVFRKPVSHQFMRAVAAERFPIEFRRLVELHLSRLK